MRKTLESSGLQRHKQSQKEKKIQNEFLQKRKEDHQQVKGILGQLKESKESPLKKREELFQKLREELEPHMKAEEKTFYQPLMKKKEALRTPKAMEEHHVAEVVLKELEKMEKGEEWGAKMSVFKELVEPRAVRAPRCLKPARKAASGPKALPTTIARRGVLSQPNTIRAAHIASALVFELSKVEHAHVREAMVGHLRHIEEDLAKRAAAGLALDKMPDAPTAAAPVQDVEPSPRCRASAR